MMQATPQTTSQIAYQRSRRGSQDRLRRIESFVRSRGIMGATGDEIEIELGIKHQSLGHPLLQLRENNVLWNSGKTRPTRSGYAAIVWVHRWYKLEGH